MLSRRSFHKGVLGTLTGAAMPGGAISQVTPHAITAIDSHAHVFKRGLPLADTRRYAPDYDATPEQYIEVLDRNGVSNAVLVQPSFLGTDNSYLVEALKQYRERFRGIAVVAPNVPQDELLALNEVGVVGIRLNLIGAPDPQLNAGAWPGLLRRLADLDWQVEVQAEAQRWPVLIGPLLNGGVKVVADHFGRPDPALGVNDPSFRHLLETAKTRRVWLKLSGSYRNGADGVGQRVAEEAVPLLRDSFGVDRLIWGSDWPHTQFEKVVDYPKVLTEMQGWLPSPQERKAILIDTPASLFRFLRS
jgi:predicted TIM-barrel fold metal-dependent hydrolase